MQINVALCLKNSIQSQHSNSPFSKVLGLINPERVQVESQRHCDIPWLWLPQIRQSPFDELLTIVESLAA